MNGAPKQVYVHANMTTLHEQRFLRGVFAYAREQNPIWSVHWGNHLNRKSIQAIQSKHGLFCFGLTDEEKQTLESLKLPIVHFGSINLPWPGVASVTPDNRAVGRMAAEYFLDRLYRHFVFFGSVSHTYSPERLEGFRQRLAGLEVMVIDNLKNVQDTDERVAGLLRSCPRPLAVFGANDLFARRICRIAYAEGISVPDELAVLGVDREELVSLSCPVPLSSVDIDSERLGHRAAEVMHGIFAGTLARDHTELFPPCGVMTDLSTDTLATEDTGLAKALQFIREQAYQKIQVEDVARHAGVGRRTLERKFSQLAGKTIDQSIRQARIERARSLLRESKLSLDEVSERCGFSSTDYFSKVFKTHTGQTPAAYRRE